MAQTNNNQNNTQAKNPFTPEPMDVPAALNTFLSSVVDKALKNLVGESKELIDTRLGTNIVKGKFSTLDLLLVFESYQEKLQEGKSKTDAAGEALMETLLGIVGGVIGGAVGSVIPGAGTVAGSVVGTVIGSYFGSKFGGNAWQEFNDFLKALAEWSVKNGYYPESPYAEKVRRNLREGTRRIDPLVIDLDGDGIELTDINKSTAMFDLTGSGFANRVGWVSPDDAFFGVG
jgi:hypothetical protein